MAQEQVRTIWRITLSEFPSEPFYTEEPEHAQIYRDSAVDYDVVSFLPAPQVQEGEVEEGESGAELIAAERRRQRSELAGGEGWDEVHDDEHLGGDPTQAAIAYAIHGASLENWWPLIAAEIDRLQRKDTEANEH